MAGQIGEVHVLGYLTMFVEKRRAECGEAETAAEAGGIAVAVDGALNAFGGDGAGDILFHFHEDEPAVATVGGVEFHNGVASGSRACEGVEDEGGFVAGELEDAFN